MLLGFDIGGTKSAAILGRLHHQTGIEILDKTVLPTNLPVYEMIESLFLAAELLLEKHRVPPGDLRGIGISCGGPLNSQQGIIMSPPNLPGWDHIPITDLTEKRFHKKVYLQNDANACAVAEWKFGAGRGARNLIFLTFGTGMGAGLVLDGKLYSGTCDLAGEVGHLRLADMGPVGFGKAGSFEGFCSGGGIAQLAQGMAREKIQMGQQVAWCPSLRDLPAVTARLVAEAAFSGDSLALAVYEQCARYLGRGLALLIDILNPELIILGSIFERAHALLEPVMMEVIGREALAGSVRVCKIVPAGLSEQIGDMAALTLAASGELF